MVDPYTDDVRQRFSTTAHAGRIDGGYQVFLDDQGVRIRLTASADQGALEKIRFLAWGCPHFIAAAELFCEQFEGRPVAELLEFSAAGLMKSLAIPQEKTGRILVLEDAARSLGSAVRESHTDDIR